MKAHSRFQRSIKNKHRGYIGEVLNLDEPRSTRSPKVRKIWGVVTSPTPVEQLKSKYLNDLYPNFLTGFLSGRSTLIALAPGSSGSAWCKF